MYLNYKDQQVVSLLCVLFPTKKWVLSRSYFLDIVSLCIAVGNHNQGHCDSLGVRIGLVDQIRTFPNTLTFAIDNDKMVPFFKAISQVFVK